MLSQIIDSLANGEEEKFESIIKEVTLNKVRERLGNNKTLTEVGDVKITNNDVFVSGKKVGSVNIDDSSPVVEFTDLEGESRQFDDTESLYRYLNGLNESDNRQRRLKSAIKNLPNDRGEKMSKAADRIMVNSNAGDGKEGSYKRKDTRKSEHKDSRMDSPKKHDHGHDDESGIDMDHKSHSKSEGKLPKDKKHSLKKTHHKDGEMENPKRHDHGYDDESGIIQKKHKRKKGSNPPDKDYELKGSHHKDSRMENPKKHDHGHDDPTATGKI